MEPSTEEENKLLKCEQHPADKMRQKEMQTQSAAVTVFWEGNATRSPRRPSLPMKWKTNILRFYFLQNLILHLTQVLSLMNPPVSYSGMFYNLDHS